MPKTDVDIVSFRFDQSTSDIVPIAWFRPDVVRQIALSRATKLPIYSMKALNLIPFATNPSVNAESPRNLIAADLLDVTMTS